MSRSINTRIVIILYLSIGFGLMVSFGQKQKKLKNGGSFQLKEVGSDGQNDIFDFPNLNKIRYYSDAQKLNKIKSLDTPETQEGMYSAVKEYVRNF
ncbi:MAG: hypothetical protein LW721_03395, partial [Flammeovirgaceae bacterium]|nr:hypothetical protein [Flammeovirgaceae bacterium]